jgi:tetratricopeptide (TPR) repeat protein
MEDLRGVTGTFRYEIVGSSDVPAEAQASHQEGRRAGAQGDSRKSLVLLKRASSLAPQWPYPVYDTAYTHLLMKDYDAAREYYRETVKLSPRGFFTAITALDTLEREQKGELPTGTYLAYLSLEWIRDSGKRAEAVHDLVKRLPQFAPAWKELASLADQKEERLAAIENGLAANPDSETKGTLQINKALALNTEGDKQGAVLLLAKLILDPNSTLGTEHLAKFSLANIVKK